MTSGRILAVGIITLSAVSIVSAGPLLAVNYTTGELYDVSPADASLTLVGNTGITNIGALEFAPDGQLYGIAVGPPTVSTLYRIDPMTAAATPVGAVGALGVLYFEGGLAFAPDGTAYALSSGDVSMPQLIQIDLNTGVATPLVTLDGQHDINGLAYRSDGQLVGLNRATNGIVVIDPATGTVTPLAPIVGDTGAVGGMTAIGDTGYFATSAPGDVVPGSNRLYSFDLFTGTPTLIGTFAPAPLGAGISGLALIPEPGALVLLLAGSCPLLRRRQRRAA